MWMNKQLCGLLQGVGKVRDCYLGELRLKWEAVTLEKDWAQDMNSSGLSAPSLSFAPLPLRVDFV